MDIRFAWKNKTLDKNIKRQFSTTNFNYSRTFGNLYTDLNNIEYKQLPGESRLHKTMLNHNIDTKMSNSELSFKTAIDRDIQEKLNLKYQTLSLDNINKGIEEPTNMRPYRVDLYPVFVGVTNFLTNIFSNFTKTTTDSRDGRSMKSDYTRAADGEEMMASERVEYFDCLPQHESSPPINMSDIEPSPVGCDVVDSAYCTKNKHSEIYRNKTCTAALDVPLLNRFQAVQSQSSEPKANFNDTVESENILDTFEKEKSEKIRMEKEEKVDCLGAVAQCEDKMARIKEILAKKKNGVSSSRTASRASTKYRPRKMFVDSNCVQFGDSLEDQLEESVQDLETRVFTEFVCPGMMIEPELVRIEPVMVKCDGEMNNKKSVKNSSFCDKKSKLISDLSGSQDSTPNKDHLNINSETKFIESVKKVVNKSDQTKTEKPLVDKLDKQEASKSQTRINDCSKIETSITQTKMSLETKIDNCMEQESHNVTTIKVADDKSARSAPDSGAGAKTAIGAQIGFDTNNKMTPMNNENKCERKTNISCSNLVPDFNSAAKKSGEATRCSKSGLSCETIDFGSGLKPKALNCVSDRLGLDYGREPLPGRVASIDESPKIKPVTSLKSTTATPIETRETPRRHSFGAGSEDSVFLGSSAGSSVDESSSCTSKSSSGRSLDSEDGFNEVKGRFRTQSSGGSSEDSFVIVFSDSPANCSPLSEGLPAPKCRKASECGSEDSFVICFESDGEDNCFTSTDVFGEPSETETETEESDSEDEHFVSGRCSNLLSCSFGNSISRTISDLTDESLYLDCDGKSDTLMISDDEDEDTLVNSRASSEIGSDKGDTKAAPAPAKKIEKRVRFSESPPKVHVLHVWTYAARKARAGKWEQAALDRERFKHRIADVDMAIAWVLKPQHRARVKFQRFMPWWHAQRRREVAESKERLRIEKERQEELKIEDKRQQELRALEDNNRDKLDAVVPDTCHSDDKKTVQIEIGNKSVLDLKSGNGGKDVRVDSAISNGMCQQIIPYNDSGFGLKCLDV